jgi:hypothetical protein
MRDCSGLDIFQSLSKDSNMLIRGVDVEGMVKKKIRRGKPILKYTNDEDCSCNVLDIVPRISLILTVTSHIGSLCKRLYYMT